MITVYLLRPSEPGAQGLRLGVEGLLPRVLEQGFRSRQHFLAKQCLASSSEKEAYTYVLCRNTGDNLFCMRCRGSRPGAMGWPEALLVEIIRPTYLLRICQLIIHI